MRAYHVHSLPQVSTRGYAAAAAVPVKVGLDLEFACFLVIDFKGMVLSCVGVQ